MPLSANIIIQRFDEAAARYDDQASVQAQIARQLVAWGDRPQSPETMLDLGCGTGFVAAAAREKWPRAQITAFDSAPSMLQTAQNKMPDLKAIAGDAIRAEFEPQFDIIFSSMLLHWLPHPRETLLRWKTWLRPGGWLYVALLTAGSFQEWRNLCHARGLQDGLWPMPRADFADGIASASRTDQVRMAYPSARHFLHRLKNTGAATPCSDHRPLDPAAMRRLLDQASKPFAATYRILYLALSANG